MINIKAFRDLLNSLDLDEVEETNLVLQVDKDNEWIISRLDIVELSSSNKNLILKGKPINPDESSFKPKMEVLQ